MIKAAKGRLLLHLCCAPCGTVGWTDLLVEGWDVTAFFWGANIHPYGEWVRRREAVVQLSKALDGPALLRPWAPEGWFAAVRGLEREPEGGARCEKCFALQLQAAADAARQGGFDALCTSLTSSRQKSPELINRLGRSIAERQGLYWEERIWRRNNGAARSAEICRRLGLYRQDYCGCLFSLASRRREGKIA